MRGNRVQFAVVREDPRLEAVLLERLRAEAPGHAPRVLLIASGGCTALSLQALFPRASFLLLDLNPSQLDLVRHKVEALRIVDRKERLRTFNVEDPSPKGLCQCGNFESLFRGFREFLFDLVAPYDAFRCLCEGVTDAPRFLHDLHESPYWRVAFELFFCDALLQAMFGPEAIQHAPRGSYPAYFRAAFERGLVSPGAADNPFLHHVFLGHYLRREAALPLYLLRESVEPRFDYAEGELEAVLSRLPDLDLVSLSNLFDWMDLDRAAEIARHLCEGMSPGSTLILRQLNSDFDLRTLFCGAFDFDDRLGAELLTRDRSLFYSRVVVGRRRC